MFIWHKFERYKGLYNEKSTRSISHPVLLNQKQPMLLVFLHLLPAVVHRTPAVTYACSLPWFLIPIF